MSQGRRAAAVFPTRPRPPADLLLWRRRPALPTPRRVFIESPPPNVLVPVFHALMRMAFPIAFSFLLVRFAYRFGMKKKDKIFGGMDMKTIKASRSLRGHPGGALRTIQEHGDYPGNMGTIQGWRRCCAGAVQGLACCRGQTK